MSTRSRAVLLVLDGFGLGKETPFNAINNAKMPFFKDLMAKYPHSKLITHGEAVGLPEGIMGNSEVGHMTMGAGRIIYQDLSRISKSIRDRTFFKNPVLLNAFEHLQKPVSRVHLMGLLSDGGVHSHIEHLFALLELCSDKGVPEVYIHAFLDGRDTPPESSLEYLKQLENHPVVKSGRAKIASLCGRYYAMDRDKRWDRVEKAYEVLTGRAPTFDGKPLDSTESRARAAVRKSHENGKTDEFVEPLLLEDKGGIGRDDAVIFFNYRSDRARELTDAFSQQDFRGFERGRRVFWSHFVCMTQYDPKQKLPFVFGPQNSKNIFGEWLENYNLQQFRIAETEKYAHVTFFFNGGREAPFRGEDRIMIPSPRDVATYDLKPEMSAYEVATEASTRIQSNAYDFVLMNFANADMVGHTGNYEAAVKAMIALDKCIGQVVGAAEKSGYHTLITADHGNAEEMCDSLGRPHTQHTLNPVPAIWVAPNTAVAPRADRIALKDGTLADIMPTLCQIMTLPLPKEVTGKSLLP